MNFPDGTRKRFFLNEAMTFGSLKEMFALENHVLDTQLSYKHVKSSSIDDNYSITKFLSDQKLSGHVEVSFNEDKTYILRGLGGSSWLQLATRALDEATLDPSSVLHWHARCSEVNVEPGLRGLIADYAASLHNRFAALKSTSAYTDTEVLSIMAEALAKYGRQFEKNVEELSHRLNEVESTIVELEREKALIEARPRRRVHRYLWAVIGVSLLHILSFYYMIFHVEWLGWDIIEPLTYTISQFSVLLVVLYWARFGRARSVETIINNYVRRGISKNRLAQKRFDLLERLLGENYTKRRQLKGLIDLHRAQHNSLRLNEVPASA